MNLSHNNSFDYCDFNQEKKEVNRLDNLRSNLKEKRNKISKKLKHCDKQEKEKCLAELKAIETLRKKSKDAIKKLK